MNKTVKKTFWGMLLATVSGVAAGVAAFFLIPAALPVAIVSGAFVAAAVGVGCGVMHILNTGEEKDQREQNLDDALKNHREEIKAFVENELKKASVLAATKGEILSKDLATMQKELDSLREEFRTHVELQEQVNLELLRTFSPAATTRQVTPSTEPITQTGLAAHSVFPFQRSEAGAGDVRARTADLRM